MPACFTCETDFDEEKAAKTLVCSGESAHEICSDCLKLMLQALAREDSAFFTTERNFGEAQCQATMKCKGGFKYHDILDVCPEDDKKDVLDFIVRIEKTQSELEASVKYETRINENTVFDALRKKEYLKKFVDDRCLQPACPHCNRAVHDWTACASGVCPVCRRNFCIYCLEPGSDSGEVHEHLRSVHGADYLKHTKLCDYARLCSLQARLTRHLYFVSPGVRDITSTYMYWLDSVTSKWPQVFEEKRRLMLLYLSVFFDWFRVVFCGKTNLWPLLIPLALLIVSVNLLNMTVRFNVLKGSVIKPPLLIDRLLLSLNYEGLECVFRDPKIHPIVDFLDLKDPRYQNIQIYDVGHYKAVTEKDDWDYALHAWVQVNCLAVGWRVCPVFVKAYETLESKPFVDRFHLEADRDSRLYKCPKQSKGVTGFMENMFFKYVDPLDLVFFGVKRFAEEEFIYGWMRKKTIDFALKHSNNVLGFLNGLQFL